MIQRKILREVIRGCLDRERRENLRPGAQSLTQYLERERRGQEGVRVGAGVDLVKLIKVGKRIRINKRKGGGPSLEGWKRVSSFGQFIQRGRRKGRLGEN